MMAFRRLASFVVVVEAARMKMSTLTMGNECEQHTPSFSSSTGSGIFDAAESGSACRACTGNGCTWCPLTSTCSKEKCKKRKNIRGRYRRADNGYRRQRRCRVPNWHDKFFEGTLGTGWETEFKETLDAEVAGPVLTTLRGSLTSAKEQCAANRDCAAVNVKGSEKELVGIGKIQVQSGKATHIIGRFRHHDTLRCTAWLLGWNIPASAALKDDGWKVKDRGEWACTSALLRHGTLGLLDAFPEGTRHVAVLDLAKENNDMGLKTKANGLWPESYGWAPLVCELLSLKKAWSLKECLVTGFGVPDFAKVRQHEPPYKNNNKNGAPDLSAKLLQAVQSGPLINLNPGAGKSGSTFAKTFDGQYLVKLGLMIMDFVQINEPKQLRHLIRGEERSSTQGALPLSSHYAANPMSAIDRVYGMLRLDMGHKDSFCIWMEDAGYHVDHLVALEKSRGGANLPVVTRYDMKGTSRHEKRTAKDPNAYTLMNGDFTRNEGRIKVSDFECLLFRNVLRKDNAFLNSHKMIDYSFFLEVVHNAADLSCADVAKAPLCLKGGDNGDTLYTFTIIDTVRYMAPIFEGSYKKYHLTSQAFANTLCPLSNERRIQAEHLTALNKRFASECDADVLECAYKSIVGDTPSPIIDWGAFEVLLKDSDLKKRAFEKTFTPVHNLEEFIEKFV